LAASNAHAFNCRCRYHRWAPLYKRKRCFDPTLLIAGYDAHDARW